MHDREDAGALEVVLAGGDRIGKQHADIGRAPAREGRHPRRDEGVDLTPLQQLRNGGALGRIFHPHAGRQLDGDLLRPAGILDAAAHPGHVGRLHAVVVLQHDAGPDAGGELIFRQPDALALEVGRRLDAVGAHPDRIVPERPRHEGRHADIGTVPCRGLHRRARHRQFADVEILAAEGAEEDLLGRQRHEHRIDAVDLHRAVDHGTHPVVIADRNGQLEFRHLALSFSQVLPWLDSLADIAGATMRFARRLRFRMRAMLLAVLLACRRGRRRRAGAAACDLRGRMGRGCGGVPGCPAHARDARPRGNRDGGQSAATIVPATGRTLRRRTSAAPRRRPAMAGRVHAGRCPPGRHAAGDRDGQPGRRAASTRAARRHLARLRAPRATDRPR